MSAPITQHDVTVTFDSTTAPRVVTFDPADEISIPTELGLVTFTLKLQGTFVARFPSNPIQWVDGNLMPIDPPRAATVRRLSDVSTTILIVAPPGSTDSFSFYVVVQTQAGRFFGSDPTIVTMRPSDG
jgi:hypothetical protein